MKKVRFLFPLALLLALVPPVLAQNPNAPGQVKKDDPGITQPRVPAVPVVPVATVDAVAAERAAIATAKTLAKTPAPNEQAKGQTIVAAEELLTPFNLAKANTPEWRMETAQRLVHLAEQLAREGKAENIAAVVQRALQHLAIADNPSQDAETRAAAKTLAAFIHERYLADETAARANYEAAAQLFPGNTKAKEASERLKKTEDNVKDKLVKAGK